MEPGSSPHDDVLVGIAAVEVGPRLPVAVPQLLAGHDTPQRAAHHPAHHHPARRSAPEGSPHLRRREHPMELGSAELTWLGHSAIRLRLADGTTALIDPWLTGHPSRPEAGKDQ